MPIFADEALVLDTQYVVAITLGEGEFQDDGRYFLFVILNIGGKPRQLAAEYRSLAARDHAFAALRALVAGVVGVEEA